MIKYFTYFYPTVARLFPVRTGIISLSPVGVVRIRKRLRLNEINLPPWQVFIRRHTLDNAGLCAIPSRSTAKRLQICIIIQPFSLFLSKFLISTHFDALSV